MCIETTVQLKGNLTHARGLWVGKSQVKLHCVLPTGAGACDVLTYVRQPETT